MRILAISNLGPGLGNPWGGVFISARLQGLVSAGNDVTLIYPLPCARTDQFECVKEADVIRTANARLTSSVQWNAVTFRPTRLMQVGRSVGAEGVWMPWILEGILKRCVGKDFDVIQAHGMYGYWSGSLARELGRRLQIPYTLTLHGSDVNHLRPWKRNAFRQIARDATGMFFVSEALRSRAYDLNLVRGRSAVTPNGIDPSLFGISGRTVGERLRVLFVGNLIEVKGADRIPAIVEAIRHRETTAEFRIVGSGQLQQSLEEELVPAGVTILGRLQPSEVASEMRRADVLIAPSRDEGWSCVAVEAQACGARVVATEVGGLVESVGLGGELVSSGAFDADEFALAVLRQWRRADLDEIAERALEFDWEVLARRESNYLREWCSE